MVHSADTVGQAKAPVVAKKPVAVAKPVAKPIAKAPVAVKKPVTAAKPVAKPIAKAPVAAAKPVAVKPVAKPVTKAPVKPVAAPVAKTPVKAAPAAPAKASASAKPSKLPKCTPAQVEAREFEARERALEARLFGSSRHSPLVPSIFLGPAARETSTTVLRCLAAFTLPTVSWPPHSLHALEFQDSGPLRPTLLYRWTGAGQQVFTFPGENADWLAFQQFNANPNPVVVTTGAFAAKAAELFTNDMIAGCALSSMFVSSH
ncbi:hypothetical protein B0H19DRAFT_519461 [Mycena capillaripes]|nr:hypothetical protein B0H19DRAFT_519461 [Mycena capillaripes]